MKFLKGKKGIIISFIIGVILASSITVYASSLLAKDITYKDGKNVADALNDLYSKKSLQKTLLWTNINSSSTFDSQTINLSGSLSDFSHLLVQWKPYNDSEDTVLFEDIFKNQPYRKNIANGSVNNTDAGLYVLGGIQNTGGTCGLIRYFTYNSDTQLNISAGRRISDTNGDANNICIPMAIYGLNLSY